MVRLDKQEIKQMRERYTQGATLTSIAREFGRSVSAVLHIVKNHSYHDPGYSPPVAKGPDMAMAISLRKQGFSMAKIARTMKCPYSTLRHRLLREETVNVNP